MPALKATVTAGGDAQTISLKIGHVITVQGSAGAVGSVQRIDPVLGGSVVVESFGLSPGTIGTIGPYAQTQTFVATCTVGSAELSTSPGASTAAMIVVSSAAPSNADGRPDGTIYIQTAP